MCGCSSCTGNIFNSLADGHTCGDRIQWVIENYEYIEEEACKLVADEYPSICGSCHSGHCGSLSPAPTRPTASSPIQDGPAMKVMSYNTEYTGKSALVLFCHSISCAQYDVLVYLYLIAFANSMY